MESNKLLRDIGLTQYESDAYSFIIETGVCEANNISKQTRIPIGKIYVTLETLRNKGLIEIQNSRPKRYQAKNLKIACSTIYKNKKCENDLELENLNKTLKQIENKIKVQNNDNSIKNTFWTVTTNNEETIKEAKKLFDESKKEIYLVIDSKIRYTNKGFIETIKRVVEHIETNLSKEIKVKIIDHQSRSSKVMKEKFKSMELDKQRKEKILKLIEIRTLKTDHAFCVIDNTTVALFTLNPIDMNKLYALLKIYDSDLATNSINKFNELWKKAKKVNLDY